MKKHALVAMVATLAVVLGGMAVAPAGGKAKKARTLHTVTQRYEVAAYAYADHADDPANVTEDGRLEWGGVYFAAVGKKGRYSPTITGRDDNDLSGTKLIYISACQDVNGDDFCNNEGGDIRAKGCVGTGKTLTMFKARQDLPISVLVYAVNTCPNAKNKETSATTGTVTLRWRA